MRYSERRSYAIATLSLSQHILSLTFEKNIIDQFPKACYNKLNPHPLANNPVKRGCMPIQREGRLQKGLSRLRGSEVFWQ